MEAPQKKFITPEAYLELERKAEFRSEYFAGEMFAVAGASREHSAIVFDTSQALGNKLDGTPCNGYAIDMRVKIPATGLYTYPDIVVSCGEEKFEDDKVDVLLNPALIIEVLSPSTENYDRGKKFAQYRTIDSLKEYVLIAQNAYLIEKFTKQPSGVWVQSDAGGLDKNLLLRSLGIELPLRQIYKRVTLNP